MPWPTGAAFDKLKAMNLLLKNVEGSMPVVLHPPTMTDDEYFEFCQQYEGVKIERMSDGSVVFMAPAAFETGFRRGEISVELGAWAERDGRGHAFSNTEYILPDGSALCPDASWVSRDKIEQLSSKQKRIFPRLCPDFVVELMSPSDRLRDVKKKMQQWIGNGVQLGWLIDPDSRTVIVYRPETEPETIVDAERVSGEGPVMGFVLELEDIWAGL